MIDQLHTNQRMLVSELLRRGAHVSIVDIADELLEVEYGGRREYLLDRFSSFVPFHMVKISADKHLAKELMKKSGVCVPEGSVFTGHNVEDALAYAKDMYPVVLKPNWGSHGDFVESDISDSRDLETAIWHFVAQKGKDCAFIIEKFIAGIEHRLFITALGGFAVIEREPASVTGDGTRSILELCEAETQRRKLIKSQEFSCLCPLVLDKESDKFLARQGLGTRSVVGTKVYLRHQSNLAKGGLAIDRTEQAHHSVKKLALRALKAFPGMPAMGLDLITRDITKPLGEYAIIEANSSPGLAMHMFPTQGAPRDVAGMLADVMFPYIKKD